MAIFSQFIPILKKVEGGYQKLTEDRGNYNSLGQLVGTNFGISARFYEGIIKRPPSIADMLAITKDRAKQLYKIYFWDDIHGDMLKNQSVANLIADHAVNGGEGSIGRIVQRILVNDFNKKLVIDGDIGPKTAMAINSVSQDVLFQKIKQGRVAYYKSLNSSFLTAWLNRLENFGFTKNA
jgi:lysozyme family protein